MAKEIERKFIADLNLCKGHLIDGLDCTQGYISKEQNCTTRVRILGTKGYLTLKSKTVGISRDEFEYEIPISDAQFMLDNFCGERKVQKIRYKFKIGELDWVVDKFYGANEGLVLAEVELKSPQQQIEIPKWVKCEVSGDYKYFNSQLAINPYSKWK